MRQEIQLFSDGEIYLGVIFDLLNFSMGFNIIAPYMVCVTHKWISPSLN